MNLDRFSQGLPDPQEAEVKAYCEGCGGEIYEGEEAYVVEGEILHAEWECLVQYIDPEVKTIEEALDKEGEHGPLLGLYEICGNGPREVV